MTSHPIRWRDPVLWPYPLSCVPVGYTAVTDADQAYGIGLNAFRSGDLPSQLHKHFVTLWDVMLRKGFQPSGLLLACLSTLPPVLGHTSDIIPKRLARFCYTMNVWCRVPGKLYPHPRGDIPGQRTRCYLVLTPDHDRALSDTEVVILRNNIIAIGVVVVVLLTSLFMWLLYLPTPW